MRFHRFGVIEDEGVTNINSDINSGDGNRGMGDGGGGGGGGRGNVGGGCRKQRGSDDSGKKETAVVNGSRNRGSGGDRQQSTKTRQWER